MTDWVAGDTRELTYELTRFRRITGAFRLTCTKTDTLWHACIDFLTYSDDHPSQQSGLCPSGERSQRAREDISGLYRSFLAVFEWLSVLGG